MLRLPRHWISGRFPSAILMGNSPPASQSLPANAVNAPSFSPDGRWLAYGWGPHGKWDVCVRPFPPDGSKETTVSQGGGRIARWLPNGRQLVYEDDDHRLMVVDYHVKNATFIAGKPQEWTPGRLADTGVISQLRCFERPHPRARAGVER